MLHKNAGVWIRTADLWFRKRLLCQLSHNQLRCLFAPQLNSCPYMVSLFRSKRYFSFQACAKPPNIPTVRLTTADSAQSFLCSSDSSSKTENDDEVDAIRMAETRTQWSSWRRGPLQGYYYVQIITEYTQIHGLFQFMTFFQFLKVAYCKKHPWQFHWHRGYLD